MESSHFERIGRRSLKKIRTGAERLSFSEVGAANKCLKFEIGEDSPRDIPPNHVLVKFLRAPINPADLNFIAGVYGRFPDLPAVPGNEGCGIIAEVGDGVDASIFSRGQRVLPLNFVGSWQSWAVLSTNDLLVSQTDITVDQLAMLKVNPGTAWLLLTSICDLPPGSWVVQNAANSGVGQAVIQLARLWGIHTINFVRNLARHEKALALIGADWVLPDTGEGRGAACEILARTDFPLLAFNAVGGASALGLMDLAAGRGPVVTYGALSRGALKVPNRLLIFRNLELRGFWLSKWLRDTPLETIRRTYQMIEETMARGDLVLPIDSRFALAQFQEAIQREASPERNGKVIFQIAEA